MDDITRDVPLVSGDQIAEITPIHEGGSDATQIDPIIVSPVGIRNGSLVCPSS